MLLTGGRTAVGVVAARHLHEKGICGLALGRKPITTLPASWRWQRADLEADMAGQGCWPEVRTLLHAAPLWLLPALLAPGVLPALRRVVAVSSTSLVTKQHSNDAGERQLSLLLQQAEARSWALAGKRGVTLTLLRPTMLYGVLPDRHLTLLSRCIARLGWVPLPGPGSGLRQPLHAADLAQAMVLAVGCEASFGRTYTVSGGETLSYRAMVVRLFAAQGRRPHLVKLPPWLLRLGFAGARLVPRLRHLQHGMLLRLERDQVFDGSAAQRDLGLVPRPFDPCAVAWRRKKICNENHEQ